MKLISHRGNITNKNPELENSEAYIEEAILLGYDVEVDIWVIENVIYLGHDSPQYRSSLRFLEKNKSYLWCHAKNYEALCFLLNNDFHCFTHDRDDYTITSKGIIWAYTGKMISDVYPSISVMPENNEYKFAENVYGICSDEIACFK